MSEPTVAALTLQTATLLHFEENRDGDELVIEELCKGLMLQIVDEIIQTLPFLPLCECVEAIVYGNTPDLDAPLTPCYRIPGTIRYTTKAGEIVSDEVDELFATTPTIIGTPDELQAIIVGLQRMRTI
jgi:hypothetical protein